jgi:hypothetical protein
MVQSQRGVDVSDDETPLDYVRQTTAASLEEVDGEFLQEASHKGTTFKQRKSIIDKQDQATFWSISSFLETSS